MSRDDRSWVSDEELALLNETARSRPSPNEPTNPRSNPVRGYEGDRGTISRYPWAEWLDGRYHEVKIATLSVQPTQFQTYLSNTSRRKGLYIKSAIDRERGLVCFQAFRTDAERKEAWGQVAMEGGS